MKKMTFIVALILGISVTTNAQRTVNRQSTQETKTYSRDNSNTNTQRQANRQTSNTNTNSATYNRNNSRTHTTSKTTVNKHTTEYHHHPRTTTKTVTYVKYPEPEYITYRRAHHSHHYVRPTSVNLIWNTDVYHSYCKIYPEVTYWGYHRDYRIFTIPAYEAYKHIGEIRKVYGKVKAMHYIPQNDEYYLYIGEAYPYQDLTVIIPGRIARRFHRHPEYYFNKEHIEISGLITTYNRQPEIIIKRTNQIARY